MNCPFCNCSHYQDSYLPNTIFNGKNFKYVACKDCKLIYVTPIPSTEDFALMYTTEYQGGANKRIAKNFKKKLPGLRFSYSVHFDIIKHTHSNLHVLDYGCGDGNFVFSALESGIECYGAEFNPDQVKLLNTEKENHFFSIDEVLSNSNLKFDVIRLSNVLEHMPSPMETVAILMERLSTNGILLVEGPVENNICLNKAVRESYFLAKKLFTQTFHAYHKPTHLFFSNYQNQLDFFTKFNLKLIEYRISDNPWPFPETIRQVKGLGDFIKFAIGFISRFTSKIIPKWGNTFLYVGRKEY